MRDAEREGERLSPVEHRADGLQDLHPGPAHVEHGGQGVQGSAQKGGILVLKTYTKSM